MSIFNFSFISNDSNNLEDIFVNKNDSSSFNEDINNDYTNINNNIYNRKTTFSTFLLENNGLREDFKNNQHFSNFENEESIFNIANTVKENKQKKIMPLFSIKKVVQHSKFSDDNKMIKIRTFLGNNIHKFLNGLLEKDNLKLLKLEPKLMHEGLKREYIVKIWTTTLKDIYLNTKINSIYRKISVYESDKNIKIINKIYNENKNKEVIQILNLTYGEIFEIFRRDIKPISLDLSNKIFDSEILNVSKFERTTEFFGKIKEKEKNNKNVDEYINGIKDLCLDFIDWFKKKIGRKEIQS